MLVNVYKYSVLETDNPKRSKTKKKTEQEDEKNEDNDNNALVSHHDAPNSLRTFQGRNGYASRHEAP